MLEAYRLTRHVLPSETLFGASDLASKPRCTVQLEVRRRKKNEMVASSTEGESAWSRRGASVELGARYGAFVLVSASYCT